MKTTNLTLIQTLNNILRNAYSMNGFHRSFVWSDTQIQSFFTDLCIGVPIGTITTIDSGSAQLEHISTNLPFPKRNAPVLVIDGVQRLCSLAFGFLDLDPNRKVYFDLKQMFFSTTGNDSNYVVILNPDDPIFDGEEGLRYIELNTVMNDFHSIFRAKLYLESAKIGADEWVQLIARITLLFENLRTVTIPFTELKNNHSLNSIKNAYVRLNTLT
ncbi:DUF262 domain-containing protein [Thalassotalea sp. ND16A]|uniref:DUF262 domain-containing protein n=1 Tax=Thalassotalea sp. ND16A TaxID=1535422 RepID=UPI00051A04AF|nr:DUF262 domain-containing protein [Thalassotalea sp. ND16A]KGK00163.1 hypothetical protein ND16A_3634 [Thalassotalea sp. ND16A]